MIKKEMKQQGESTSHEEAVVLVLTKFRTGGREITRSTSLVGRAKPVALDPNKEVRDRGQSTCRHLDTLFTAQVT